MTKCGLISKQLECLMTAGSLDGMSDPLIESNYATFAENYKIYVKQEKITKTLKCRH